MENERENESCRQTLAFTQTLLTPLGLYNGETRIIHRARDSRVRLRARGELSSSSVYFLHLQSAHWQFEPHAHPQPGGAISLSWEGSRSLKVLELDASMSVAVRCVASGGRAAGGIYMGRAGVA